MHLKSASRGHRYSLVYWAPSRRKTFHQNPLQVYISPTRMGLDTLLLVTVLTFPEIRGKRVKFFQCSQFGFRLLCALGGRSYAMLLHSIAFQKKALWRFLRKVNLYLSMYFFLVAEERNHLYHHQKSSWFSFFYVLIYLKTSF